MSRTSSIDRPRVRFSLRWKITLPFMFLALMLALAATVIVNRVLGEAEEVRFLRQLADSGQQAADEVVRIEERLLEIERAIANTEGVASAVALNDSEALRERVLSLVFNTGVDVAVVLDREGTSLLTVRKSSPDAPQGDYLVLRGEGYYKDWLFVQLVLLSDFFQEEEEDPIGVKQAGMQKILIGEDQEEGVLFVAGPLVDEQGTILGAVLVGEYLDTLVGHLSADARAQVSIYSSDNNQLLSSTFDSEETWDPPGLTLPQELIEAAKSPSVEEPPYREIGVAGQIYGDVLTPLIVRHGTTELGMLSISLLKVEGTDLAYQKYMENAVMVIRVGAVALVLIVLTGLVISNTITRPLVDIADASTQVAFGNLDTQVIARGSDEVGVLAQTFNSMVAGLREGAIYRDLLGRTVTPEVRDELRTAIDTGGLLLEGQTAKASILFADLQGFTTMAETADPEDVMRTLNDYFSGVVPIITRHGGVVNKFDGDAIMAFFGILPFRVPPQVSALQATHAAMEILDYVKGVNERRSTDWLPALEVGIGVSTGTVIAGGIGSKDRLHYTVLGDTVNTSQRIQQITRVSESGRIVISEDTYKFLANTRKQFEFGRRGRAQLRGKRREVMVYEVTGRWNRLVDCSDIQERSKTQWEGWQEVE
ncbi:MAG TPA: HAMP domain-containing protein [Anaerolineae bacterium]|nr:HAMP domain-containing protein [Anaerolineae bacterium]